MGNGAQTADARRRYRVQSVDRALVALEALAEAGPSGLTLSELARELGISKSTALSLLRTLVQRDFVSNSDGGVGSRYRLGLALARLGDQVLAQTGLLEVGVPVLERLTAESGRTSRLGVLDGGYVVVVARVNGPGFIQVQSNLGRRELPHCSALGKAILAQFPDERVREIVAATGLAPRTAATITDVESLLEDLRVVRERGYALDDEEDSPGVFCVGATLGDHRGRCVGAISITDVKLRGAEAASFDEIAQVVVRHAHELSERLGAPVDPA